MALGAGHLKARTRLGTRGKDLIILHALADEVHQVGVDQEAAALSLLTAASVALGAKAVLVQVGGVVEAGCSRRRPDRLGGKRRSPRRPAPPARRRSAGG